MQDIPVNPETVRAISEGYLSLGIVGGAMLFVLIITVVALIIFGMQMKSVFTTIADKLEGVGASLQEFTKALILNTSKNDSDQAETLRMLNQINDTANDIRKKVVRIDDRTYACLGNTKKEEGTS
ncbi:hypothetical protein SAMN02745975_00518 [Geosporobacter subterraneus DSM 17957]|uniref:Uncharacterized protein n=1 Tax=Geosporobacter subterraneus DSM 17957 TaxID=1121919 RepID=A0A1M6DNS1_9FIRM|nr:hypothetical protein [Geosporobacter subterraneus]SHI74769.1 hypothetical protein SAMN02745975_00518 [Geosporobacter subterraneus DSM 17957]